MPCESPLPEEEQAKAVAAMAPVAPAPAAVPGAPLAASAEPSEGKEEQEEDEMLEIEAAPAATAPPDRVPARALYGLPVDEDEQVAGQGAAGEAPVAAPGASAAPAAGGKRDEPRLLSLPRMDDDGRLPAYALAGGEGGWQAELPGRPSRKSDRGEEDPPSGFQPTDLFIGEWVGVGGWIGQVGKLV